MGNSPGDEFGRLLSALAAFRNRQAGNIIRLLILTGARRGEVQGMEWGQLDLDAGVWIKPAATTKQKRAHRVPLNGPARQLLSEIWIDAEKQAKKQSRDLPRWIFPARGRDDEPIGSIKRSWATLCRRAKLGNMRLHDLRHCYATILASSGASLPVIGALLGHTQAQTTQRYAHLRIDPLREMSERVATFVTSIEDKNSGQVLMMRPRRRVKE